VAEEIRLSVKAEGGAAGVALLIGKGRRQITRWVPAEIVQQTIDALEPDLTSSADR
jgi:hypothetical protein